MDLSNNNQIKINPKDLHKISPELILNIILKDGSMIILDESIPSQDINELLKNSKNENNNDKNKINTINGNKSMNDNKSINMNTHYSYANNINGKTLEMNDSYLFNQNNLKKEILTKSNNNNTNLFYSTNVYNNNDNNNRFNNFRSQNQSISDFVTEKFHKKFHSSVKNTKKPNYNTTINSEININIQGNNSKQKYSNNLLKDFNELLLNFNDKKKGLNNQDKSGSKKKYKFYKRLNCRNHDRLLLDDLSGISPNTKAIKYIGRNEQKNSITTTCDLINKNNNFNNAKRLSFLQEKAIKRHKSNKFYLLKNNSKNYNDIIVSPPNNIHYTKLF